MDTPGFIDPFGDFPFDDEEVLRDLKESLDHKSSYDGSTGENDPKKEERLVRNREIAKRCRKRKRERADALIEELNRLRETNRDLELQLKVCQSKLGQATSGRGNRGVEEEKRRVAEINHIRTMVEQGFSDEEVKSRLENYSDKYSDFGEERNKVVHVCLGQLEKLLMPTQVSKMLLWILEQNDDFFSNKDPTSVWNTLVTEVELDDKQKEYFLSQRSKLGCQNQGMKKILHQLKSLSTQIEKSMEDRKKQVTEITEKISPVQQAKFLKWVEENQACIHLLDNLWLKRTNSAADDKQEKNGVSKEK